MVLHVSLSHACINHATSTRLLAKTICTEYYKSFSDGRHIVNLRSMAWKTIRKR